MFWDLRGSREAVALGDEGSSMTGRGLRFQWPQPTTGQSARTLKPPNDVPNKLLATFKMPTGEHPESDGAPQHQLARHPVIPWARRSPSRSSTPMKAEIESETCIPKGRRRHLRPGQPRTGDVATADLPLKQLLRW